MNRLDALRYLRRIEPALVPIAAPSPGICCEICRSGVGTGYSQCSQCFRHDIPSVLPISMSLHQFPLHHRLRGYKDAPSSEARREHALVLAALLGLFLQRHRRCLGEEFDFVVTVPSISRDAFAAVVDMLRHLRDRRIRALRATGETGAPQYELVTPQVEGKVVLLLDDTFTSGRSIAAAHRAIAHAGARIIGPVVIGRHFYPEFSTSVDLWGCLQNHEWSLEDCGLCGPVDCQTGPLSQAML